MLTRPKPSNILYERQLGACFFRDRRIDTQHELHVTGSVNRLQPVERSQYERWCHSAMEQRANIKFCYKLGKTDTEKHEMLVQVYGRETVSRKCVLEWLKSFREGKDTTENEPRSGGSSASRTPEMIEKVRQMLAQDRQLTLRLIAEELGISKDTAHTIMRDDLGKRKICCRFVPHKLTDEQKPKRMESSGDFISLFDQDPLLLEIIVTGDETWCYQFDPESKRQSMTWCSPTSPRPKKSFLQKSKVKLLLIAFFDNKGIIHKEFVPTNETINAIFNQTVLNRLLQRIRQVRSELYRTGKMAAAPR